MAINAEPGPSRRRGREPNRRSLAPLPTSAIIGGVVAALRMAGYWLTGICEPGRSRIAVLWHPLYLADLVLAGIVDRSGARRRRPDLTGYRRGMTLRVNAPAGKDPVGWVWGEAVPGIGARRRRRSRTAVYSRSTLPLREFEAARTRIEQINQCHFCLDWRTQRDRRTRRRVAVRGRSRRGGRVPLSERERLAAAFRRALRHRPPGDMDTDEAFWAELRRCIIDAELLELTLCIGSWVAFGRLNHVFGLDTACVLPSCTRTPVRPRGPRACQSR